jgi:hypothetical protein
MEIRVFVPGQVSCVQQLLDREYTGYPYPVECRSEHISYVATDGDDVVAFARAKRDLGFKNAHVYEFGTAIVDPKRRVRGTMHTLAARITTECWARGADFQHTEMVTFVPGIQKVLPAVGFQFCGLELAKHPRLRDMSQPESVFFAIARPDGVIGRQGPVFLPPDYQALVASYLPSLLTQGSDASLVEGAPEPYYHAPYERDGVCGSEFIDVAVNWPEAIDVLRNLRTSGWYFSGVLPGLLQTTSGRPCDGIRLQRLPRNAAFDPALVQAIDPTAAVLKRHVVAHLLS